MPANFKLTIETAKKGNADVQVRKNLEGITKEAKASAAEIREAIAAAGDLDPADAAALEVFADNLEEISDSAKKAKAGMDGLGDGSSTASKGLTKVSQAANKSAKSKFNAGRATLELSRGLEDLQFGVIGVLNNIPPLLGALGAGAGLAGIISIVAVAGTQLVRRFGEMKAASDSGAASFLSTESAAQRAADAIEAVSNTDNSKLLKEIQDLVDEYDQLGTRADAAALAQEKLFQARLKEAEAKIKIDLEARIRASSDPVEQAQLSAELANSLQLLRSQGSVAAAQAGVSAVDRQVDVSQSDLSNTESAIVSASEALSNSAATQEALLSSLREIGVRSDQQIRVDRLEELNKIRSDINAAFSSVGGPRTTSEPQFDPADEAERQNLLRGLEDDLKALEDSTGRLLEFSAAAAQADKSRDVGSADTRVRAAKQQEGIAEFEKFVAVESKNRSDLQTKIDELGSEVEDLKTQLSLLEVEKETADTQLRAAQAEAQRGRADSIASGEASVAEARLDQKEQELKTLKDAQLSRLEVIDDLIDDILEATRGSSAGSSEKKLNDAAQTIKSEIGREREDISQGQGNDEEIAALESFAKQTFAAARSLVQERREKARTTLDGLSSLVDSAPEQPASEPAQNEASPAELEEISALLRLLVVRAQQERQPAAYGELFAVLKGLRDGAGSAELENGLEQITQAVEQLSAQNSAIVTDLFNAVTNRLQLLEEQLENLPRP